MPKAVKSLLVTLLIIGLALGLCGISWYAATHPWFATHILLPILGVVLFFTMWAFCHQEMQS